MRLADRGQGIGGSPVLRFAPSPTGPLHLGSALSALTGYDMACRLGGRFLLRVEDTDRERCRPEHIRGIREDLAWLGIRWEEPVLRQSEHLPVYAAAARRLEQIGLLYPCFASRAEILAAADPRGPRDPDGTPHYPGLHKGLGPAEIARRKSAGQPFTMRLDTRRAVALVAQGIHGALTFLETDGGGSVGEVACDPARWGDAVLMRKDGAAAYHLAVVVDDARQGVTLVTRGQDLFAATDLHRLLQVLLELPAPVYHHHALLMDESGRKLSKSDGDTAIAALRRDGATPADIRRRLGL